jgi:hypothetical protein
MDNEWLDYCKTFIPKIKARHKQMLGRECNLDNPQRLTDKLEWLKVYDSTFLKTYCSDKLTARKYVAAKLGKDISIPVLGVYNTFDEIDFGKLPKDYVIKTNHGSHTNVIVRNGKIDKAKAHRERFDAHKVRGAVIYDANFPGCPHCHTNQFWICGCGTVVCWHGQKHVTCPNCGYRGGLEMVSSIELSGGGL